MISAKSIFKHVALYLVCLVVISAGVYAFYSFYGQKVLHLDKKQWHPAEPETQHIDPARLNKALHYVDTRLPTARSLLLLRNGKTIVEKYCTRSDFDLSLLPNEQLKFDCRTIQMNAIRSKLDMVTDKVLAYYTLADLALATFSPRDKPFLKVHSLSNSIAPKA